jgi:hypothetical protein
VSVLASVSLVSAVKYLTSTLHFPFGAPYLPTGTRCICARTVHRHPTPSMLMDAAAPAMDGLFTASVTTLTGVHALCTYLALDVAARRARWFTPRTLDRRRAHARLARKNETKPRTTTAAR